jgi:imidazole glycerol phosphate synthase subunit HisF
MNGFRGMKPPKKQKVIHHMVSSRAASKDVPVVSGLILRAADVPKFLIIIGHSSDISINKSALQNADYIEDISFLFSS